MKTDLFFLRIIIERLLLSYNHRLCYRRHRCLMVVAVNDLQKRNDKLTVADDASLL